MYFLFRILQALQRRYHCIITVYTHSLLEIYIKFQTIHFITLCETLFRTCIDILYFHRHKDVK